MKPALWLVHIEGKYPNTLYDDSGDYEKHGSYKTTRLYTAHEIADFVRGLYFDDNFIKGWDKSVFAEIADKIEEES